MKKIVDYQVIENNSKTFFENSIKDALHKGWELHGSLSVIKKSDSTSSILYIQAVILHDKLDFSSEG